MDHPNSPDSDPVQKPLTLSEKVRLTNSQLVPALAYRLITHSLSPNQLEKASVTHLGGSCVSKHHTSSLPQRPFCGSPKGRVGYPHVLHHADAIPRRHGFEV